MGDQYLKFFRKEIPDLQLREKIAATFEYQGEQVTWYFDKQTDAFDALARVKRIRSTYWDYPIL